MSFRTVSCTKEVGCKIIFSKNQLHTDFSITRNINRVKFLKEELKFLQFSVYESTSLMVERKGILIFEQIMLIPRGSLENPERFRHRIHIPL